MADRTPEPAMRLVFEYEGDQVRLISQTPVSMVVAGNNPAANAPGIYVDSRSADDAPLARVRAPAALLQSAEVFPEKPGERIHRVDQPRRGAFSIVVPAPEAARHVTVVEIAPDAPSGGVAPPPATAGIARRSVRTSDGAAAVAIDLARFPLDRR